MVKDGILTGLMPLKVTCHDASQDTLGTANTEGNISFDRLNASGSGTRITEVWTVFDAASTANDDDKFDVSYSPNGPLIKPGGGGFYSGDGVSCYYPVSIIRVYL